MPIQAFKPVMNKSIPTSSDNSLTNVLIDILTPTVPKPANSLALRIFTAPKGCFFGCTVKRKAKTLKACNSDIEKESRLMVRSGIDYDKIATVKDGRQDGSKPSENAGLPWGVWETFPYSILHNGQRFVRLSLVPGKIPSVRWFKDGVEVNKSDILDLLQASEKQEKDEAPEVITVKESNITEVRLAE